MNWVNLSEGITAPMTDDLAERLASLLPAPEGLIPWTQCDLKQRDKIAAAITPGFSNAAHPPGYWVVPPDAATLGKVVQVANEQRQSLLPWGSGSKLSWGASLPEPRLVVTTRNLNRIVDHATGDLTVTVEAGMTLQALQIELAEYNQFLPLNPPILQPQP
jgi:glycolate oxidase FAD binding subunit